MVKETLTSKDTSKRSAKKHAAAQRALKEAEDRRVNLQNQAAKKEIGGRKGPDPARFGDWEVKGIASDF